MKSKLKSNKSAGQGTGDGTLEFKLIIQFCNNRNGTSITLNVTAPDSITSFELSAFCMSESLGLGIAATEEVGFRFKTLVCFT